MGFNRIYPLVNVYITMENHHFLGQSTISMLIFKFANCKRLPGRVDPRMSHQALSHRNLEDDARLPWNTRDTPGLPWRRQCHDTGKIRCPPSYELVYINQSTVNIYIYIYHAVSICIYIYIHTIYLIVYYTCILLTIKQLYTTIVILQYVYIYIYLYIYIWCIFMYIRYTHNVA